MLVKVETLSPGAEADLCLHALLNIMFSAESI